MVRRAARLADERLVPLAVLAALGVREAPGRAPLAVLAEHLRARDLLVVLDNCEHLVQAAAELSDALLGAGPGVRVLATSRERLGVAGEVVWRVPSLPTPDPGRAEPPGAVARYAGVRLFADRACAAERGWALTAANTPAVAAICRRLDGLPLAIELAAARVPLLTVEQIADRLGDRFRLLTVGSRTALPRHRTLRALIDWSYDLLSASESTFFNRLAVFAGGFTLEAASAVCGQVGAGPRAPASASGAPLDARDRSPSASGEALELLGSLVDRSLVLVRAPP